MIDVMLHNLDIRMTETVNVCEFDKVTRSFGLFGALQVLAEGHFNHTPLLSAKPNDESVLARTIMVSGVDVNTVIGYTFPSSQNYTQVRFAAHNLRLLLLLLLFKGPLFIFRILFFLQLHMWLDEIGTISRVIATESDIGVVIEFEKNFNYRAVTSSPNIPECADDSDREFEVVFPSPVSVDGVMRSRNDKGTSMSRRRQLILQVRCTSITFFHLPFFSFV
jgi:hypothetical protein